MSTATHRSTEGLVGLSMLAIMALALIAGQARPDNTPAANLYFEDPVADVVLIEAGPSQRSGPEAPGIRRFRVMPRFIEFGTDAEPADRQVPAPGL